MSMKGRGRNLRKARRRLQKVMTRRQRRRPRRRRKRRRKARRWLKVRRRKKKKKTMIKTKCAYRMFMVFYMSFNTTASVSEGFLLGLFNLGFHHGETLMLRN